MSLDLTKGQRLDITKTNPGLVVAAIVLTFIGVKMLIEHWVEISSNISLFVTLGTLTMSIVLSLLFKKPCIAKT